MSEYHYPRQDALFVLRHLVDIDRLSQLSGPEDLSADLIIAVLDEAARFGAEQLAPSNVEGDRNPATLAEGEDVREPPGFAALYHAFCEAGWPSLAGPLAFGGQGLPKVLSTAAHEIWNSANLAWALCPLLTEGAVEAIEYHGSDAMKAAWLPRLISGEWTGTMNLTEPDAGSDLAALRTRAVPEDDHYRITGQKIFITWGDHRMSDNIVHLVLARLPDAPPGVKGISLFLVPKYLLDPNGEIGERNDLRVLSIEHKLGIHGSPTCVMSYGERGGAVGYLLGKPHRGLACMFTMMNSARQAVGMQGLAVSERAYQQAREYARQRVQGTQPDGSRVTIIHHPDVRRMLLTIKAANEAMRALAYEAAAEVDRARAEPDPARRRRRVTRVALYTPIVKGWLTELAQEMTGLALQVHGGMGFIEETGVAQYYRDARILTIYEGTTGIQALDLIGRKIQADQGDGVRELLREIGQNLNDATRAPESLVHGLQRALTLTGRALEQLAAAQERDPLAAPAGSVSLLLLLGYLCGGWMMLRSAQTAADLLEAGEGETEFLKAKRITAQVYAEQLLPRCEALYTSVVAGSASLMQMPEEQF